jgi:hypothetical protein
VMGLNLSLIYQGLIENVVLSSNFQ